MPNKNYFAQLSPKQKAELFLIYTGNGMYNLDEIMNHYNSEMNRAYSSTDKDMVARMHDVNAPYLLDEEGNKMTHMMASGEGYVFPTIQRNDNGDLEDYGNTEDWGAQRAIDRGDTLQFKLPTLADYFSENYKTHLDNPNMYDNGGPIDENDPNFIGPPRPVDNETLVDRQRYAESAYNNNAYNKWSKASGAYQITPTVLSEYTKRTGDTGKLEDYKFNRKVRDWYMNKRLPEFEMYRIGSPTDSVRTGRKYAAFNTGPGAVRKAIKKAIENNVDVNNSFDWLKYLPKETSDYVNFIVRGKDIPNTSKTNTSYESAKSKFLK